MMVVGAFLLGCASSQVTTTTNMNTKQIIEDTSTAISRAILLSGLDVVSDKISAERMTLTGNKTPFLSEQLNGKSVWRVRFGPGSLKLKSSQPGFVDKYQRIFDVILDATTGQLFGVECKFGGAAEEMRPDPETASAERQLRAASEVYVGLPAVDPKITFLSALDVVLTNGGGSPFVAKEIAGIYVMDSEMNSAPRAVWVITLRGLPPYSFHGPAAETVPIWHRNHMRSVIDAMRGKFLFATNYPTAE